jgi:hypothetical protein
VTHWCGGEGQCIHLSPHNTLDRNHRCSEKERELEGRGEGVCPVQQACRTKSERSQPQVWTSRSNGVQELMVEVNLQSFILRLARGYARRSMSQELNDVWRWNHFKCARDGTTECPRDSSHRSMGGEKSINPGADSSLILVI